MRTLSGLGFAMAMPRALPLRSSESLPFVLRRTTCIPAAIARKGCIRATIADKVLKTSSAAGGCLVSVVIAAVTVFRDSSSAIAYAADEQQAQCLGINTSPLVVAACIVQALALVGAAVGGTLARQRKQEVEKINAQLRQIFAKMRRQYQVENYAPALTYAPVGLARQDRTATDVFEIEIDPRREELVTHLRAGKRLLREKKPEQAYHEFQKAIVLAKQLGDTTEEKKAARGLGASCQRQGRFRDAINYHRLVLTISHISGEHSGDTEALGAIADCYTELGDLENAAKFYDQYIAKIDED